MPTFRSNTSPNTLITVNMSNYRNGPEAPSTIAYATVNWSVTTSSATSCSSSRTLQIFNAWGTLLGSGQIKGAEYWGQSTTHSGSFTISFNPGPDVYYDFAWPIYIQVPGDSSDPCTWMNRSYCTNFDQYWPVYWSYATAPSSLWMNPNCYENSIRLEWSGANSGINNGISTYHCYYQYSDDGYNWSGDIGIDSSGATYVDVNTSTWPRGRYLRFQVYSIASRNNSLSYLAGNAQKNRVPNTISEKPTVDKSVYIVGDHIQLSFTPNSTPDPDGNIAGYEVAMKSDKDVWYGSPTNVGEKTTPNSPYVIDINTATWDPGKRWKFYVRGYDSFGVRGAWSPASDLVMIGVALKINVGNAFKDSAEALINVNGQWKQIAEMNININGAWKNFT